MIRPLRSAIATSSARVAAESLPSSAPTWNFTVCSEMASRSAIARLLIPSATSSSTSRSRGVSGSTAFSPSGASVRTSSSTVPPGSSPVRAGTSTSSTRAATSIGVPRSMASATARSCAGASVTRSRGLTATAACPLSAPAVSAGVARRPLADDHRDFNAVAATDDSHSNGFADAGAAELPDELLQRPERPAFDADEDVADERARALSGPAGLQAVNEEPPCVSFVRCARTPDAHGLRADAEIAARHPAAREQLVDHRRHEVDRQRERGAANDPCRVDGDDAPAGVHQGPAGVTRERRGVELEHPPEAGAATWPCERADGCHDREPCPGAVPARARHDDDELPDPYRACGLALGL